MFNVTKFKKKFKNKSETA